MDPLDPLDDDVGTELGMLDSDGMALTLGPSDGLLEGVELGMELTLGSRLGNDEGRSLGIGEFDGSIEG